ncbi:copper homeostasis periplasmic binding protein CopC [Beijerinckia sp. L45]|uniref:copper homeostasis periplasmic binding protein CopC n=1 Tax=Beijerinckia sp. L45 TaxID=1641855 RepID=UPI001AEF2331|nr:copper homeostasis periplasmic binding protein CopC [Beijerinckia sp. L45]
MQFRPALLLLAAAVLLSPLPAFAHAQLLKAVPGVGTTVTTAPSITLAFSEPVEPAFCGIALSDAAGKTVPLGKPASAADKATLVAAVKARLAPGTYTVTWHAVSVDTHRTQGTFAFTLAP